MNTVLQQINQHVSLTIDQSHDSWDDDQNQSKHLDEGQQTCVRAAMDTLQQFSATTNAWQNSL